MPRKVKDALPFRPSDIELGQDCCHIGDIGNPLTGLPKRDVRVLDTQHPRQLSLTNTLVGANLLQRSRQRPDTRRSDWCTHVPDHTSSTSGAYHHPKGALPPGGAYHKLLVRTTTAVVQTPYRVGGRHA